MKHCLFYGSLKSNHYNFGRFSGQKVVKKLELDGYELYSLGAYPAVCAGKGKVTCELQTVDDNAFANIQRMEAGAGYTEQKIKLDDNVTASIFVMDKRHLADCKKVESGNW